MALSEWRKNVIRGFRFPIPAFFLLTVTIIARSSSASLTSQIKHTSTQQSDPSSVPHQSVPSPSDTIVDYSSLVGHMDDPATRLKRNFMRFGRDVSGAGDNAQRVCYPLSNQKIIVLHQLLSAIQQNPAGKRFMRFGRSGATGATLFDDDDDVDRDSDSGQQDAAPSKRFMRFGKRFMRFGRQSTTSSSSHSASQKSIADICFWKDDGVTTSSADKRFMRFGRMLEAKDVRVEDALAEPTFSDEN